MFSRDPSFLAFDVLRVLCVFAVSFHLGPSFYASVNRALLQVLVPVTITAMDDALLGSYRREFPVTEKHIYLDHAGVSPISLRVKAAIEEFLSESAGGAAFHYPAWAQRIVDIRRTCAKLIASDPDEIAFVKSTSHGLSIVAEGLDWMPGDNPLVDEKEFPSNLYPWLNLQRKGVEIRYIPSRRNRVLVVSDIERLMDTRTRLLANQLGAVHNRVPCRSQNSG